MKTLKEMGKEEIFLKNDLLQTKIKQALYPQHILSTNRYGIFPQNFSE